MEGGQRKQRALLRNGLQWVKNPRQSERPGRASRHGVKQMDGKDGWTERQRKQSGEDGLENMVWRRWCGEEGLEKRVCRRCLEKRVWRIESGEEGLENEVWRRGSGAEGLEKRTWRRGPREEGLEKMAWRRGSVWRKRSGK